MSKSGLAALALMLAFLLVALGVAEQRERSLREGFPAVATTASAIAATTEQGSEAFKPEEATARYTLWLAIGTFALAIAALAQAALTARQARLARDALEVARDSADAARKSADAAKQAADASLGVELAHFVISKVTFDLERRAYKVGFRNYGRTAGIITRTYIVAEFRPNLPLPTHYPAQFNREKRMAIHTPVLPRQQFAIPERTDIKEEEFVAAQNSKGILWVYGYFDWVDFMKREHRDGFCVASRAMPYTFALEWVMEGPDIYNFSRYKSDAELRTKSG